MNKRIVITGIGAVGPLGHDLPTIAANLGRSPDETGHGTSQKLNGQADLWMLRGLDASGTLSGRQQRKLDPFRVQGIGHAADAIRHERAQVVLCGASEDLSSPYMQAVLQRYARANGLGHLGGTGATPFGALEATSFSDGAAFLVLEELEHAQRRG